MVLCLMIPLTAGAAVHLEGDAASFPLGLHLAFLEDHGGVLGIEDVAAHDGFRTEARPGLTPGVVWYRVTATRAAGMPADWILAFGEPDIDDVRVFVPKGGGFTETRLGRRVPSRDLPLAARQHVAQVALPEAVPVTLYIRLESQHKLRFEQAALWRPSALIFAEARHSTLFGIEFGFFALLVVVYALFGLWLRDGPMLVYSAFVATILCRGMTHSGVVTLVFPDAGSGTNYVLSAIGLFGSIAAFIFMWDKILDLGKTFPVIHKVYLVVGSVVALPLLWAMDPAFQFFVRPALVIMLVASIGNIVLAALLVRRNPQDVLLKFYLFAFLPIVLPWGAELGALILPWIPVDLGRRIDIAATMGHVALLSVALAYRLGQMQRQRMQAEIALAGEKLARQRQRNFVAMATHEFKTPLAVIDSAAQMLEMLAAPARQPGITDRIATIRRAVLRLVKLIDTCLADDRDDAMAIKLRPAMPATIVAQAAERNSEANRPDITVTIDDLPETCIADADLLGIALDALIDNARRYGPADQPVDIAAHAEDGSIIFAVHDYGPGIPAAEIPFIFDKYYRCRSSGAVAGTGIGLHLVKTIADLHGGEVSYRPRDGGGASFAVRIPALLDALALGRALR